MEINKFSDKLCHSGNSVIRGCVILMMMLTTVMAVEKRWMTCEIQLFNVIPVLLLFGCALLAWNRNRFKFTLTDAVALSWFSYYIGRAWIGNEWPCQMEILKIIELFLLYVGLRIVLHETKMPAWVLIGSILIFGCYEAWLGFSQMYGNDVSRHNMYALTGTFLNPGPYSAYLMMGIVVGLIALKDAQGFWRHLIIVAVIVMAVILPATWSRAAFLGVAMVLLIIYRDKYWKYRYLVWGAVLVASIAFYLIKQGSADGRLIIWNAALTTWIKFPWLGVGIGGFYHAFAEGMAQLSTSEMDFSSANVPDGAYNILLKIVVEQGVTGGLLAISLAVIALERLVKNSKPLFYGIGALLLFAMFSYPFDLFPYKVTAVLVVAWSESVGGLRFFEFDTVKVCLLAAFTGLVSWQTGKVAAKCFLVEKDSYMAYGFMNFNSISEGYERLRWESDNHEFLFAFGKQLREEGRYNDSNAILRQGTKCSADPMFYVLIGNNYKDMKQYDMAEQAYRRAFSVMPNRLYPLFKLMQLYQDSGNKQKAQTMAKRVVEMKPKVESPATRDMKKKAMNIL